MGKVTNVADALNKKLTVDTIYQWWEAQNKKEKQRTYLGGSIIGQKCERYLWYNFRLCIQPNFSGRILRLFHRGHREEDTFIKELRGIGVEVFDVEEDGKQFGVTFCHGHGKGHCDGIAVGILEAPKTPHLLEFKTYSKKRFEALSKEGVQKNSPVYYAQCQIYMKHFELTRTAFFAVCKDDDRIHYERLYYDKDFADKLEERGNSIIFTANIPERINDNPSWYECKFCDAFSICHDDKIPAPNCRNCSFSTPIEGGKWLCERQFDMKENMCSQHLYIPTLIGEPISSDGESYCLIKRGDNSLVCNGINASFPFGEIPENTPVYNSIELAEFINNDKAPPPIAEINSAPKTVAKPWHKK